MTTAHLSTSGDRAATDPTTLLAEPPVAVFRNLNDAQANGHACIVCNATDTPHVPVGYSLARSQVFACAQSCAPLVGPHSGEMAVTR